MSGLCRDFLAKEHFQFLRCFVLLDDVALGRGWSKMEVLSLEEFIIQHIPTLETLAVPVWVLSRGGEEVESAFLAATNLWTVGMSHRMSLRIAPHNADRVLTSVRELRLENIETPDLIPKTVGQWPAMPFIRCLHLALRGEQVVNYGSIAKSYPVLEDLYIDLYHTVCWPQPFFSPTADMTIADPVH